MLGSKWLERRLHSWSREPKLRSATRDRNRRARVSTGEYFPDATVNSDANTAPMPCNSHFLPEEQELLIRMIEGEIIPRLWMAHRSDVPVRGPVEDDEWFLRDAERTALLFVHQDTAEIVNRLQRLLDRGMPRRQIYLEILAPIGPTLGILWEEKRCTLDEVARGLSCIDEVLQEFRLDELLELRDGH